jgi:O-antigen ligase
VVKIALAIFLFTLFFPVRYVFLSQNSFLTGIYSDFTSFSIYLTDFVFIFLSYLSLKVQKKPILKADYLKMFILWLFFTILANLSHFIGLQIYYFSRFLQAIVLHETIANLWHYSFRSYFFGLFVTFSFTQAIIALFQFVHQSSLGLYILGEPHLSPALVGVAKVVSGGTKYIRAYGTLPHPNLLSAVFVTSIPYLVYLYSQTKRRILQFYYATATIVIVFGLFMTFSRAGLLTACLVLLGLYLYLYRAKQLISSLWHTGFIISAGFVVSTLVLWPLLADKITFRDGSTQARLLYLEAGLEILVNKPMFGTGIGTNLLSIEPYSTVSLEPWQKQPIHNYFLLAAAELGIFGALILVYIFFTHLQRLWQKLKTTISDGPALIFRAVLLSVFAGYLFLMLFDHYFYTIPQTVLLFWLLLGIITAEAQESAA